MRISRLRRRRFITLLGGAAVAWPLVAHAQQSPKLPTIGFLGASSASAQTQWTAAFVQRLRELDWVEGRNVTIEYRFLEGHTERAPGILAEFVGLKVDVIVTHATAPVLAAKKATSSIPVVFTAAGDPVGNNIVASLARPGGNITGLSIQQTDLAAKRLELLREVIPGLHRLAIMAHTGSAGAVLEMREAEAAAKTLGIEAATFEIRRQEDIAPAFDVIKSSADGLLVATDPLIFINRIRINTLALSARVPTVYNFREYIEAGGLLSYGPSFPDLFRRAAVLVDKILRGAKPQDIPVEQPTKFDLVVNLTTAKAMGLTISESFLTRADEVIE